MRRFLSTLGIAATMSTAVQALAFDNVVGGAAAGTTAGTGPFGDMWMFELGGEWAGLRTYDGRWIHQWDVFLGGRTGWVADQRPFTYLLGAHARAWTEWGVRSSNAGPLSPYIGARLGGDVVIAAPPGVSLQALNTVASLDGVGGVVATGIARIDGGASWLDAKRSLLVVAFVQEVLQPAQTNTPSFAFTEGGIGARFDLARSLVVSLEGSVGATAARTNQALGFTDQTFHGKAEASFRKIFGNGMWLGSSLAAERYGDRIVYSPGATYVTGDPFLFELSLSFGSPLWKVAR